MTDLFDWEPPPLPSPPRAAAFDGAAYDPKEDYARLRGQLLRIFDAMKDGKPRTLSEIAALTGDPEASISAQLRHLRKPKYGSHGVERISLGGGLHSYKLTVNERDADGSDHD